MIKVTLPSGIIVEGDSAEEVGSMLRHAISDAPKAHVKAQRVVVTDTPAKKSTTYPHKYAKNGTGLYTAIGERQDQILQIGKMLAESAGSRGHEFRATDIFELSDATTLSTISSALNGLFHKGVLRHGSNRNFWVVTDLGWRTAYKVTQPVR